MSSNSTATQNGASGPAGKRNTDKCDCFLVQLNEPVQADAIFTEYAYFSSYATSWVEHAKRYVDGIVTRLALKVLIQIKEAGRSIGGYGAPGKGNSTTAASARISWTTPSIAIRTKHGKFLPGTHIPIFPPARIAETKPDYILILPWNFADEILAQLEYVREWGAQFIVPIPRVTIVPAGFEKQAGAAVAERVR